MRRSVKRYKHLSQNMCCFHGDGIIYFFFIQVSLCTIRYFTAKNKSNAAFAVMSFLFFPKLITQLTQVISASSH